MSSDFIAVQMTRKPLFVILYTSLGVLPRDYYMLLERSTIRVCHALLRFPPQALLTVLRFSPQAPIAPCELGETSCQFPLLRARHTTYNIRN
jgi:hypothetical protein